MTIEEKSEAFAEEIYGRMKKEKKITEMKVYGVDLVLYKNDEKIMTDEFVAMLKSLDGFLGFAPYGGGSVWRYGNHGGFWEKVGETCGFS